MSALGMASLGTQCTNKALGMASLGTQCGGLIAEGWQKIVNFTLTINAKLSYRLTRWYTRGSDHII